MSIKWMNHIWEERTDLKGAELLCAIAIADHADADGYCRPGLPYLCRKLRLKERQVIDLIHRLEQKKVVTVERGNGRGNLTAFRFVKGAEIRTVSATEKMQDSAPIPEKRVQVSAQKGCSIPQERVQVSATPIYKDEPSIESTDEPRKITTLALAPITTDEVLKVYFEFYPEQNLSVYQQEIIIQRIRDGDQWRKSLEFWKGNNYIAKNVAKICDYYDELEAKKNGTDKKPARKSNVESIERSKDYFARKYGTGTA